MSEHQQPSEDRILFIPNQEIVVKDFACQGYVLDIGGGGEGIIGRLKGEQVIAIDPLKRELEESPAGPLKIVMDARNLQFLDQTFNTVTSFFTLMFVEITADQEKIFSEVYRVLKPGGLFLIWDVVTPLKVVKKDIFAIRLSVKLPNQVVETGYGQFFPDQQRTAQHYISLAEKVGFTVTEDRDEEQIFYLKLQK